MEKIHYQKDLLIKNINNNITRFIVVWKVIICIRYEGKYAHPF